MERIRWNMRFSKGHVASIIDFLDEISYEAGLKIQIHSQDEPPFIHELGELLFQSTRRQLVIFLGFGISPGRQTLVSTQEQRVTFLPPPWGNCNPEKPPNPHDFFPKYSISSCRIACETKQVVKECGCRWVLGSKTFWPFNDLMMTPKLTPF